MSTPHLLSGLGLALTFGLPVLGRYRRRRRDRPLDWATLRRGILRVWLLFIGIVGLVAATGDPADLAFRVPSVGTLIDGILFGFVAFGGTMVVVGLILRYSGGLVLDEASRTVFEQPLFRRLGVAVSNATVESVLLYGFVIESVHGFGIGLWIAGVVGAAALLLWRAQWSISHAIQWMPGALVLSAIAVWSRTVFVVIIVRLLYDLVVAASADANTYEFTGNNE